jgi:hypothetical protein
MSEIGSQDGIKAAMNRLRDLDPGGTLLQKSSSGWPDISTLSPNLDTWKAWDKLQRTLTILKTDHDAGGQNPLPPEPTSELETVRARMFLANDPLDCLQAPTHMVPVCTADLGYRHYYTEETIDRLRERFGLVEAWCDCRNPTPYAEAVAMVEELGLDGPAWGQCETQAEFDHAYASGCSRMVGNLSALEEGSLAKIREGEVLVSVELYRNVQPWMEPDWKGCNDGVGGNCIACYASSTEGASYYSVDKYKQEGLYVSGYDSAYGVGLKPEDWAAL